MARSSASAFASAVRFTTAMEAFADDDWRWLVVDVVWAVTTDLEGRSLCGAGISKRVIDLRSVHREALGLDEVLALGPVALSDGLAASADVERAGRSIEEQASHPTLLSRPPRALVACVAC